MAASERGGSLCNIITNNMSVLHRSLYFAVPCALCTVLLLILDDHITDFLPTAGFDDLKESQIWTASTVTLVALLAFRIRQALGRFWEGSTLLHQMRGEWQDSVSCLFAFSMVSKDTDGVAVFEFRNTLVRLMSLCHGSSLHEIQGHDCNVQYDVLDEQGLSWETRQYIYKSKAIYGFNRVEVILHMIQCLVTKGLNDGVVKIPPPILSRVYQTLSRGYVNLLNAKKITDTDFPSPFKHLIGMMFMILFFITPVVVSSIITNKWCAFLVTFVPTFGLSALNEIAGDLEMPFGDDAIDLPLAVFQEEMNDSLLMLLHPHSDLIATTSEAALGFHSLLNDKNGKPGNDANPVSLRASRRGSAATEGEAAALTAPTPCASPPLEVANPPPAMASQPLAEETAAELSLASSARSLPASEVKEVLEPFPKPFAPKKMEPSVEHLISEVKSVGSVTKLARSSSLVSDNSSETYLRDLHVSIVSETGHFAGDLSGQVLRKS